MKKEIFLVFLLFFITGCDAFTNASSNIADNLWWKSGDEGKSALKYLGISTSLGERGIGIDFVEDLSDGIQPGEETELTIRLINHMENQVNPSNGPFFQIWDNLPSDYSLIETTDLGVSYLEGAIGANVEDKTRLREIFKPVDEKIKLNYNTQIEFSYADIISKLSYRYQYRFVKQLCVFGANPEPENLCNPMEAVSDLGWDSRYSPIAITSILKKITFVAGRPKVTLKIYLQDFGDGEKSYLKDNEINYFRVYSTGRGSKSDFNCAIANNKISFKDIVKKEVICYGVFDDVEEKVATTPFNLHIDFDFDYVQLEPLNYRGKPYSIPLKKDEGY